MTSLELSAAPRLSSRDLALLQKNNAAAELARRDAERRFNEQEGQRVSHEAEIARCARDVVHWFNTWGWTYDPRVVGERLPDGGFNNGFMPFKLWPIQVKLLAFIEEHIRGRRGFLIEKSRDMGATFVLAGFALHRWLFVPGFKTTFGSRDEDLVDSRDNPDSIFEKIRIMHRRLPGWMMPRGFAAHRHDTLMSLSNPANGAMISGEGGDEMGRGGRSSLYVIDEGAFVPRAEKVERAVSANTDCAAWVSSVNAPGGVFYRKRHKMPPEDIFVLDYHDDPRMTPDRIAAKKSQMEPHVWAAEMERDYAAAVEGVCIPAHWVRACCRLLKVDPAINPSAVGVAGLDVGAGKANSVFIPRHGPVAGLPQRRKDADTTGTAHWALALATESGIATMNFDEPGVGKGVASTLLHNPRKELVVVAVNTGSPPSDREWPDGKTSGEKFANLKAELWWLCRSACQRTFEHVTFIETNGADGMKYPESELLALPEDFTLEAQLSLPKWHRNEKGKIMIEKKEQLRARGVSSPDEADALILTFLEAPEPAISAMTLDFGDLKQANPWEI